jgi:hypothetical protein
MISPNLSKATDLLERARIMTATNPHEACALVDAARRLYPVSQDTVDCIKLLAYPLDSRLHARLMNRRARRDNPHHKNANRVEAAQNAIQRKKGL